MKNTALFLIILIATPIFSAAQHTKQLSQLFYNLPIDQSRKVIIRKINKDPGFMKLPRKDSTDFSTSYTDSYHGKIVRVSLPAQYSLPENATIDILWEVGLYTRKGREFGTDISIIKIEYFFSDKQSADAYFSYAWDQIKIMSGETSPVTSTLSDAKAYSGKKLTLNHKHKRYLSNINLLQSDLDGRSVIVEYRREGK